MSRGERGRYGKDGERKRCSQFPGAPVRLLEGDGGLPQRSPVKIGPATAGDRGFIRNLSGRVFDYYGAYQETVPQWFDSGTTMTLMASMKGQPVGFAMMGFSQDQDLRPRLAELLAIGVEPERQREGIGLKLIREIIKKATLFDVEGLFLHTAVENLSAQRLFSKSGFREEGIKRRFYPAGQDAVVMVKRIPGGSFTPGQLG